jgi:NAD(P)H-hydrate repair Nnr-like enzyme with NAD(P)H-hydrate dehydratase domain
MGAVLAGASDVDGAGRRPLARLGAIAATAAWLHGRAGSRAAEAAGIAPNAPGPVTALDVAAHLPRAVAEALAAHAER